MYTLGQSNNYGGVQDHVTNDIMYSVAQMDDGGMLTGAPQDHSEYPVAEYDEGGAAHYAVANTYGSHDVYGVAQHSRQGSSRK